MLSASTTSRKSSAPRRPRDSKGRFVSQPPKAARSQARITCDRLVVNSLVRTSRGIDFYKGSFWIQWIDTEFLSLLDFLKKQLQETDFQQQAVFNDCGLDWNLQRTGTSLYNFRLVAGDVSLLLNRRAPNGSVPNLRIEIGSLTSQTALVQTLKDIRLWMERKGGIVLKEQVTEVHLACDFIGLDIKTLGIENGEKWIQRAQSFNVHHNHRKLTGISLGKGDIMLRIYDKVEELKRSENKQEVFADLWQVAKYDDLPVTRVEYQLRRPVLKEFEHLEFCNGISDVKTLLFSLKALWNYCTHDWSRFVGVIVDRENKNQQRAFYNEFWEIVRSVVWTGLDEMRREKPVKHKNLDALRKQARGILMSICAFFLSDVEDINGIVDCSKDLIEEDLRLYYADYSKFVRKMQEKRNEILVDTTPF